MNKQSDVFLILNGEEPNHLPDLTSYSLICATDGAIHFLEKKGITPDLLTGDFDSSSHQPKDIEVLHTPDQNFTDFEKILSILHERGYTSIDIYGASGKEQDHFLGNLHTALIWKDRIDLRFFDNHGTYFFCSKDIEIKNILGKTVSLFPFPEAKNISTTGLQYPLKKESLSFHQRIGTRNKAIKENVHIQFTEGDLIVFVN